ncbi:MAG: hypothetical protein ACYTAQ_09635 [Planctomycetota bacterium]|jgi:hypothetical protein
MKGLLAGLIAALGLAACAPVGYPDVRLPGRSSGTTLLVHNRGVTTLHILQDGRRLGSVHPREKRCFNLWAEDVTSQLQVRAMAEQEAYGSFPFHPSESSGWLWEVADYSLKYDAITPVPTYEACT